jgi:hypothetical protein
VLIVTEDDGRDDKNNPDQSPRYWPSKTVEEWRAYHRAYYRDHAERWRAQARHSHLRKVLRQAFGTAIPRSLRRLLLRDSVKRKSIYNQLVIGFSKHHFWAMTAAAIFPKSCQIAQHNACDVRLQVGLAQDPAPWGACG